MVIVSTWETGPSGKVFWQVRQSSWSSVGLCAVFVDSVLFHFFAFGKCCYVAVVDVDVCHVDVACCVLGWFVLDSNATCVVAVSSCHHYQSARFLSLFGTRVASWDLAVLFAKDVRDERVHSHEQLNDKSVENHSLEIFS